MKKLWNDVGNAKISSILLFLTITQFIYTISLGHGWVKDSFFTLAHEDYVFIAHLMTFFIVKAIEKNRA